MSGYPTKQIGDTGHTGPTFPGLLTALPFVLMAMIIQAASLTSLYIQGEIKSILQTHNLLMTVTSTGHCTPCMQAPLVSKYLSNMYESHT